MVKEITCYRDSSGKIHETHFEAHRAELAIWFVRTGALNEASAQQLAERMAEHAGLMIDMLAPLEGHKDQPVMPMDIAA